MKPTSSISLLSAGALTVLLTACGGGGGGTGSAQISPSVTTTAPVQVPLILSDASSEDWSVIGVKVLAVDLLPQGGGDAVRVFTAESPAPVVNLAELDQIGELLGQISVPQGTYTGAKLTLAANAGDVTLTVAQDPQAGFDGTPGVTIPPGDPQKGAA